jgi:hypothetical protein
MERLAVVVTFFLAGVASAVPVSQSRIVASNFDGDDVVVGPTISGGIDLTAFPVGHPCLDVGWTLAKDRVSCFRLVQCQKMYIHKHVDMKL